MSPLDRHGLIVLAIGCVGLGAVSAEEPSTRLRAAVIAGMPDYHGDPFPDVIDPPPSPPAPKLESDSDVLKLDPITVDTTRLPSFKLPKPPKTRNLIERLIPGTGVTVTDTKYGRRTVGRILFIPIFFDLNW